MSINRQEINQRLELCSTIQYEQKAKRLVIPYYKVTGEAFRTPTDMHFVRYRNYAPNLPKYQSLPKEILPQFYHNKYGKRKKGVKQLFAGEYKTPLYYPQQLIEAHKNKAVKGNTVVLTEGEFKAITAQNMGVNCVSFAGISLYNHFRENRADFERLINGIASCTINIVLLYDADAVELRKLSNKRQRNFFMSALNFCVALFELKTSKKIKIFAGYIKGEQKGLDDLLTAHSAPLVRSKIINELNHPKQTKENQYFELQKISTNNYKKKLKKLFPAINLNGFVEHYGAQLTGQTFEFTHTRPKYNYTIQYTLHKNGVLTGSKPFYKTPHKFDSKQLYKQYASECLEEIKTQLKEHKKVLLKAPTGAGKTTLIEQLKPLFHRVIIVVPIRAIAQQQQGKYKIIIGGSGYTKEDFYTDDLVTTFSTIAKRGEFTNTDYEKSLLVVDEAHEIYNSFGYRQQECYLIEKLITRLFKHVLALSATPCLDFFKELDFYAAELAPKQAVPKDALVRIYPYQKVCKKQLVRACIDHSRATQRKAYIYLNSKNNHVLKEIANSDNQCLLITGETSRHQPTYKQMLDKQTAFLSSAYDTILTNAVLTTGASFQDTEPIDVHIFSNDATEVAQACSRFRKVGNVTFFIYCKKQYYRQEYTQPTDQVKQFKLEAARHEIDEHTLQDIVTGLQSNIKTINNVFSHAKTYHDFEQKRMRNQNTEMLLGDLAQYFRLEEVVEIDPAKDESEKPETTSIMLTLEDYPNLELMKSCLDLLKTDKRAIRQLKKYDRGFAYIEQFTGIELPNNASLEKDARQVLKIVVGCLDYALKFGIPSQQVFKVAQRVSTYLPNEKQHLVLECILFELIKNSQSRFKRIKNKGRQILWKNLLDVYKGKKNASEVTIFDLYKNGHLKKIRRRELYKYLDIMNICYNISYLAKRGDLQKTG
jgi:energy-coupling factor transporter ATP-binding protein EcfA2